MKPFLFFLLCLPLATPAQQRADHTWLLGVRTETEPGYPYNCMNVLDFNGGELDIRRDTFPSEMFVTNASISDSDGSLLFYTNGCYVKNALHEVMPNGGNLNPGILYDDNCPDNGYASLGGVIILPTDGDAYHLFHQGYEVFDSSPFVRANRLYRTAVDMGLDGGKGDVTAKNEPVLTSQQHTGLSAQLDGLLLEAVPNPAQRQTVFRYRLPEGTEQGTLRVADLDGRVIASFDLLGNSGNVPWGMEQVKEGVYLYSLFQGNRHLVTSRLVVIR